MKNWLIKLLGGRTQAEYELIGVLADARVETWEKLVQFTQEESTARSAEIKRLTDLMLTRAGFIVISQSSKEEIRHQPINKRKSWPQAQKELEIQDAKRAADETKRRWEEKEAAQVSTGTSGDEQVFDEDVIAR